MPLCVSFALALEAWDDGTSDQALAATLLLGFEVASPEMGSCSGSQPG